MTFPPRSGLAELRGHEIGTALLDDLRQPGRGMPKLLRRNVPPDRHDDVQALPAGGLEQRRQPEVVGHLEDQQRHLHRGVEGVVGRIDVDGQLIRPLEPVAADGRRMELERGLVPQPCERRGVVADRVRDVALGARGRDDDRADP